MITKNLRYCTVDQRFPRLQIIKKSLTPYRIDGFASETLRQNQTWPPHILLGKAPQTLMERLDIVAKGSFDALLAF
ncbi:MAG: hypothetical protein LW837_19915, partial [Roseomonas sp.]|nr:hypothetical protein [Roseomonas sp.]